MSSSSLLRKSHIAKDLVALETRIHQNSFGDYGKNLEKLPDKKKEIQK
jgi:hypothetical protein